MKKNIDYALTLDYILSSIEKKRPLTITYVKVNGETSVRTIEPYDFYVTVNGTVIVRAMDREKDAVRSFRLDGIEFFTTHRTKNKIVNLFHSDSLSVRENYYRALLTLAV